MSASPQRSRFGFHGQWPATLFAGLAVIGAALASAPPVAADLLEAESFTLANGLEVVVLPKHLAPVVYQMVVYKVGAADGAPGKNGVAHFLEHLMFKATDQLEAGEFSQIIDQLGGSDNAFTNQDMTAYHQEVAKEQLSTIMAMEADRMVNLRLDDATVRSERDVILNERSQVIDNNPSSRLREAVNAAIYRNHPYGRPVIGWRHEIAAYDLGDAQDFYQRWYAPNNAVLVVAGDVTAADVRQLAETYFGAIPARDVPGRQRLSEPPPVAERRLSLSSPEVRYPSVTRTYLAPSYRSAALVDQADPISAETPYALAILGEILSSGAVGRLHRKLVLEQGIAIGVSAGYSGDMRDYGSFSFSVAPRDAAALDAVEAALDAEIATLLADGISEEELAAAKQRLMIESVKARDGLSGPASLVAYALGADSTLADLQAWPDRIAAVKPDAVMIAARTVLTPANSVTAILLPEPTGTAAVPVP